MYGYDQFFSQLPYAAAIVAVGILIYWFITRRKAKKKTTHTISVFVSSITGIREDKLPVEDKRLVDKVAGLAWLIGDEDVRQLPIETPRVDTAEQLIALAKDPPKPTVRNPWVFISDQLPIPLPLTTDTVSNQEIMDRVSASDQRALADGMLWADKHSNSTPVDNWLYRIGFTAVSIGFVAALISKVVS